MTNLKIVLRTVSVVAVLLAASCAAPYDGEGPTGDGAANHPITVEPHFTSIQLSFSAPQAGLLPDDAARLDGFVADYLSRGSGSISVSAPAGSGANATLEYFGARLFSMGVPRSRILVGTHERGGQVEIGFIAYAARTDSCGDWNEDLGSTGGNRTARNFGCSVQQNIAAQIADPRDLVEMRGSDAVDATRRAVVLDNYEKGKITASEKTRDQSAALSDVGK
jgi:pilus assembly protein CpaD